jgi:3-carboxy-cis,cis-muconate cycloisomerase
LSGDDQWRLDSAGVEPVAKVVVEQANDLGAPVPDLVLSAATGSFSLLQRLYCDPVMAEIFSEEGIVQGWLDAEAALAKAQGELGVIPREHASLIAGASILDNIDLEGLWQEARNVGYPILPLVRMIAAALPPGPDGFVHFGATTQDMMDTGLVLQIRQAMDRLDRLIIDWGDALAALVSTHSRTTMAARTHGQQAVPTTFGAKVSVLLSEVGRHRDRLGAIRPQVELVSLYGAGGTSAALGSRAAETRARMARILGLAAPAIPWHVARDGIGEYIRFCAALCATGARFAREVIDLSRTEFGEVREQDGHHRGASSTMPQKENPIDCEGIVGMSVVAAALASASFRTMEPGHERSAGEWQAEWHLVPQVSGMAAACALGAGSIARGLRVYPERMAANLEADSGLVMAEAYMIGLAPLLGRERAHDLVYEAAKRARRDGRPLVETLREIAPREGLEYLGDNAPIQPRAYLGEAPEICQAALADWEQHRHRPSRLA